MTYNVLLTCTGLYYGSTWTDNQESIDTSISEHIPDYMASKKELYIANIQGDKIERPIPNNYKLMIDEQNMSVIKFVQKYDMKYDVIIMAQCNNLVHYFTDPKERVSYDSITDNVKLFYDKCAKDSYIFCFYYEAIGGKFALVDFLDFFAADFSYFDFHVFLALVLDKLFLRISKGVYKNRNLDPNLLTEIMNNLWSDIKEYIVECLPFAFDKIYKFFGTLEMHERMMADHGYSRDVSIYDISQAYNALIDILISYNIPSGLKKLLKNLKQTYPEIYQHIRSTSPCLKAYLLYIKYKKKYVKLKESAPSRSS